MDRRRFLGRILGTVGALTFAPDEWLWKPLHDGPTIRSSALVTLPEITRAIAETIAAQWQGQFAYNADQRINGSFPHQYQVAMRAPDTLDPYGLDHQRYIVPAARALLYRMQHERVTRTTSLSVPTADPTVRGTTILIPEAGLCVRGLQQYGPFEGIEADWTDTLRFDILCG